ncbi:MAG: hypothetical protein JSS30_02890 [Verrucomicrobia bacterium]|nr:hypothetical protein [Verrucomicrobiota bacterium]
MKNKFEKLVCCLVFCTSALFASESFIGDKIDEKLDVVYSYLQNDWIMGLSDGSSWKLMPIKEKRPQTWTEWWDQTEPKEWRLSDEFFFDPRDWRGRYTVKVYLAKDSVASGYDYILVNETTDQKVFAKFVPYGADFIPKIDYARRIKEQGEPISSTVLASYTFLDDVVTLEDKSIWKLHLVGKNSASFSEWWNGVEIDQPDDTFVSKLSDWKSTDKIDIYHAHFEDSELNQKYRVSKPQQEIYLLENRTRHKMAYANEMCFKDLLDGLQKHGESQHEKGYSSGFSEGYKKGYKDGQSKGFSDGVERGKKEAQKNNLFQE